MASANPSLPFSMASHRSIFVGNISYQAAEKQLIEVCEEIGPVISFRFIIDKKTGKKKGYGFCTYLDEETALSACRNLQGCLVRGSQLRVNLAKDGTCTDITKNQGQRGSCVGSDLGTAQHPSEITPAIPPACQLLGLSSTSANVPAMVGAIEGTQSKMISQEDFDRLTNYLARQSKCKLQAISSEIKLLAADDNRMMQMASSQRYVSHLGQMPQQSITISVQPALVLAAPSSSLYTAAKFVLKAQMAFKPKKNCGQKEETVLIWCLGIRYLLCSKYKSHLECPSKLPPVQTDPNLATVERLVLQPQLQSTFQRKSSRGQNCSL